MAIDKDFIKQFVNVTQKAALASYYFIGKKITVPPPSTQKTQH